MKDKVLLELIVVLVIAGFGIWTLYNNPASMTNVVPETTGGEVVDNNKSQNTNAKVPAATIAYADALATYKDARIQRGADCQASPNNVTYKNNSSIMLDNRSDKTRTVKVGSVFTLPAYGFKIVNLSSPTLPATWYIDCDSSQNVATILIQR